VYYRFSFPEGLVFRFQDIPYFLKFFALDGAFAVADLPVKGVLVCGTDSLWENKNISLFFTQRVLRRKARKVNTFIALQPFTSIILSLTYGTIKHLAFFHAKGAKEKSTQSE
jgi:hypothetical protein